MVLLTGNNLAIPLRHLCVYLIICSKKFGIGSRVLILKIIIFQVFVVNLENCLNMLYILLSACTANLGVLIKYSRCGIMQNTYQICNSYDLLFDIYFYENIYL